MRADGPSHVPRLAAIAALGLILAAPGCTDASGPTPPDGPGGGPPAITDLPGVYTADMTFESTTGGPGCPLTSHRFDRLVLIADPVTRTVTIEFTFPVTGPYDAASGGYAGSGRVDSSLQGFDLELVIDGAFSRDRDPGSRVVLVGDVIIRLLPEAGGGEFCSTNLRLRIERTSP
jgi:hypothetical protein